MVYHNANAKFEYAIPTSRERRLQDEENVIAKIEKERPRLRDLLHEVRDSLLVVYLVTGEVWAGRDHRMVLEEAWVIDMCLRDIRLL